MWDWLSNQFGNVFSDVNSAYQWLMGVIRSVWSWLWSSLVGIYAEFTVLMADIGSIAQGFFSLVYSIWAQAQTLIFAVFGSLASIIGTQVSRLWSYALSMYATFADLSNKAFTLIYNVEQRIYGWIGTYVVAPFTAIIGAISGRLGHLWDEYFGLITHPERIVKLIGGYLWSAWHDILKKGGRGIGRFLLHGMMGIAGEVWDVMESILSAFI